MKPTEAEFLHWLPGSTPAYIPEHENVARQKIDEALKSYEDEGTYADIYWVDNRTETRNISGRPDGDLLVLRPAHTIRPPEHTGVHYKASAEGPIHLSLNDPPKAHLYRHHDLQIDSEHNLCQACKDVLNYFCHWLKIRLKQPDTKTRMSLPNIVVHHFNILSLMAWANVHECYLCQKLMAFLKTRFPAVLDSVSIAEKYRIEVCWPQHANPDLQRELCFVLVDPTKPKDFFNFGRFYRMIMWPSSKFGHHFDRPIQLTKSSGTVTSEGDGADLTQGSEPTSQVSVDSQLQNPSKLKGFFNLSRFHRKVSRPGSKSWHQSSSSDRPSQRSRATITDEDHVDLQSTSSARNKTLAGSWLRECRANTDGRHTVCNSKVPNFTPTRLLDVSGVAETGYLRIVDSTREPGVFIQDRSWITLSHCWGSWGDQHNPLTNSANIEERQTRGIPISQLPPTFYDVLKVCGWLNVRWLWIDCLCIMQDSQEDWLREAAMMDDIYRHGVVNISANFGADSSKGLFSSRDPRDVSPIKFSSKSGRQSFDLTTDAWDTFVWVVQMPALSRVWINRERQLARRILHFNSNEMVWECCGTEGSAFASEMFPNGSPFKQLFRENLKYQIGVLQTASDSKGEQVHSVWNEVCENFSRKGLTKPSDMPIVLSSLAKEFTHLLDDDQYVAGLWRSTMPHSLAWKVKGEKRTNMTADFAPSWSWLSTGSHVGLREKIIQKEPSLVHILDMSLIPRDNGIFGDLECGHLSVQGFLRHLRVSFSASKVTELGYVEDGQYRCLGPDWHEYWGYLGEVILDQSPSSEILDCFCLPVMLVKWPQKDYRMIITCLLLQMVNSADENRYRRIGMVEFSASYALRLRYTVASGHANLTDKQWELLTILSQAPESSKETRLRQASLTETDSLEQPSQVNETRRDLASDGILSRLYQYDARLQHMPEFESLVRLEPRTLVLV